MGKTLVSKSNYGRYASSNYGSHTQQVSIGDLDLYFSYDTVVAFRTPQGGFFVRENDWGPTTGKHLNWIDGGDKKGRLSPGEFDDMLKSILKLHNLIVR